MTLLPNLEERVSTEVRSNYEKIKKALDLFYTPLFFTYVGVFPEYLNYLTDQLVANLQNPKFNTLIKETKEKIYSLIKSILFKSEEIQDWLNRYENSPSFYNFQKDLEKIFTVNLKLVFIFIALREALKGWAVAAKKLPASNISSGRLETPSTKDKDFIFEDALVLLPSTRFQGSPDLAQSEKRAIEKDLLPRYIFLCQQEFNQLMKKEEFLILRGGIEKIILSTLPLMPEKIVSPINIFYKLNEKYRDFPDLLYLMSEHFPTLAVQKMMFSGFMKNS
ncbi:hypothetical protein A3C25_00830 [Candidatus Roizmanbacteria bacterium RIFCSPHIGHO2_02_FULL_38_11]|uniref:Uncharacterized protein n=1 Tax=Candidatus Roizmanbacteria bacterium RIFCSPHIGHO2_02_FULL_38_11 TaxID=1802039 RepID=A0A1F7GXT6_9BACT|nr:MAG: hypothetical protein A3C25_00830 [Candidatus Roizmanbacteria bacterium RIFCSPHIGHO2_02_FULL_38_11]